MEGSSGDGGGSADDREGVVLGVAVTRGGPVRMELEVSMTWW